MSFFVTAVVVSFVLFRQSVRHRKEREAQGGAPLQVRILEVVLTVISGCLITAAGVRMLFSMFGKRRAVTAIDNPASVLIFLSVGLSMTIIGLREIAAKYRSQA